MVVDEVRDGRRIAQLLASELRGHERGPLGRCAIVDAQDVEGSEFGEFAYGIEFDPNSGERVRLADVFVHDERARVEFRTGVDAAVDARRGSGSGRRRPSHPGRWSSSRAAWRPSASSPSSARPSSTGPDTGEEPGYLRVHPSVRGRTRVCSTATPRCW